MSDTQQRIDDLVKSSDVVLFMKGSASFPMCGFSGRAIQILKACGVDPKAVKTVNVLDDDAIRQGIHAAAEFARSGVNDLIERELRALAQRREAPQAGAGGA